MLLQSQGGFGWGGCSINRLDTSWPAGSRNTRGTAEASLWRVTRATKVSRLGKAYPCDRGIEDTYPKLGRGFGGAGHFFWIEKA